jgi:hypothetical protein
MIVAKIDVEGAEYSVLAGAEALLQRRDLKLLIELHGWGDSKRGKYPIHVLALMLKKRFSVRKIGTSYLFEPAQSAAFWLSYVPVLPVVVAKFLLHGRLRSLRPLVTYAQRYGLFLRT